MTWGVLGMTGGRSEWHVADAKGEAYAPFAKRKGARTSEAM